MDLTNTFPRSPYDMLAGLVMLPRTTDKVRAQLVDRLGEYLYGCPLDEELFAFLGIDAKRFMAQVATTKTDEEVAHWIDAECSQSQLEKDAFNNRMRHLRPEGDEGKKWLEERRKELGRDDFSTYFDLLDADEGRF